MEERSFSSAGHLIVRVKRIKHIFSQDSFLESATFCAFNIIIRSQISCLLNTSLEVFAEWTEILGVHLAAVDVLRIQIADAFPWWRQSLRFGFLDLTVLIVYFALGCSGLVFRLD